MSHSTSAYEVYMHRELVDELDDGFSPMDGIQAINDVFVGLPLVHRSKNAKHRHTGKTLRVYRGRFSWYPELGFNYVEIGSRLHVLEFWIDKNEDSPVDATLPATDLQERGGEHVA